MAITQREWGPWGPVSILDHPVWRMEFLPGFGGILLDLYHKPSATHVIRMPSVPEDLTRTPYLYGMPLLYPAGRIAGGRCVVGDRVWQWPLNDPAGPNQLHGFLWDAPFAARPGAHGDSIVLEPTAAARHSLQEMMGEPLDFSVEYAVELPGVTLTLRIANRGRGFVPLGVGFHMNLLLQRPWLVTLPPGQEWAMGKDLMPTGKFCPSLQTLEGMDTGRRASTVVSDTCFRPFPGGVNVARLDDPVSGLAVRIAAPPPFSQWVVYRPHLNSEFISLEPYTWVHNAPNLPLDPEITGLARLDAGQEVEAKIRWEIDGD